MGLMNAQQMAMGTAQIDATEAAANAANAKADKDRAETPTGGRNLGNANYENIIADTGNKQADAALTTVRAEIAGVEKQIQSATVEQQIDMIISASEKIGGEVTQIYNNNWVTGQTMYEMVDQIKANLVNTYLQGSVMKAGINLTNAQINKISQDIAQGWAEIGPLDKEGRSAKIQQLLSSAGLMDKEQSLLLTQTIISGAGAIGNIISNIGKGIGGAKGTTIKNTTHNWGAEPNVFQ